MLRADGLALAALHAVRGLMTGQCVDGIVVIIRMPVVVDLLRVHRGEQFRDGDLLRAADHGDAPGKIAAVELRRRRPATI